MACDPAESALTVESSQEDVRIDESLFYRHSPSHVCLKNRATQEAVNGDARDVRSKPEAWSPPLSSVEF